MPTAASAARTSSPRSGSNRADNLHWLCWVQDCDTCSRSALGAGSSLSHTVRSPRTMVSNWAAEPYWADWTRSSTSADVTAL